MKMKPCGCGHQLWKYLVSTRTGRQQRNSNYDERIFDSCSLNYQREKKPVKSDLLILLTYSIRNDHAMTPAINNDDPKNQECLGFKVFHNLIIPVGCRIAEIFPLGSSLKKSRLKSAPAHVAWITTESVSSETI